MSMGDRVMTGLGKAVRDGVRTAWDKEYERGYNEAANLCVGVLTGASEGLLAKMTSGGELSAQEQILYARLTELKAEMEELLYASCEPPSSGGTSHDRGASTPVIR
ncbi:hypothetical protein [Streptomyces venezuelae]|uniref:hypothetical protein n=1 Tax=Streptomyces venezuelae TaxID=54571 RepID=UPI0036699ED0